MILSDISKIRHGGQVCGTHNWTSGATEAAPWPGEEAGEAGARLARGRKFGGNGGRS